jgi:hypothetical protein
MSQARMIRARPEARALPRHAARLALTAALLVAPTLIGTARAADQTEFWPELSAFLRLNEQTRAYLDLAYAKGKESFNQALDVVACLDVSIQPILRPVLRQEDWTRNRYLWTRFGYTHVFKAEGGVPSPAEDRGIVSFFGKGGLPGEVWVEGRARADLRLIEDQYSQRYRVRGEATREFTLFDHPVTPYFNFEWFYDTRYDGWARTLAMGGTEVTVSKRFRFELYVARQEEHLPSESVLNAFGVVAKGYY